MAYNYKYNKIMSEEDQFSQIAHKRHALILLLWCDLFKFEVVSLFFFNSW